MLMPQLSCAVQQAGMLIPPNMVGGQTTPLQMTSPPSGCPPAVPPDPPVLPPEPPVDDPPVPPVDDPPVPPDAPEPPLPADAPVPEGESVEPPHPSATRTRAAPAQQKPSLVDDSALMGPPSRGKDLLPPMTIDRRLDQVGS